ncbi:hypothetical protein TI03_04020 [Achromatium sp. WMS1]|nr:hypothetical protein TI03_04020 [Achromatium sp. WMS1]
MNEIPTSILLGVLFLLLLLSAFFSSSETALMMLNRYRLKHLAKKNNKGAQYAQQLLKRPDRLIGVILLGNNFVNILASSLATIIAMRLLGDSGVAISAGVLTLLILIFSEVTPKTLAALYPERIAFPAARIYAPLLVILYPLVWLVNGAANMLLRMLGIATDKVHNTSLSKEELRTVVQETGAVISVQSRKMLIGILDLENVTVEDIMISRNEVDGINLQDSMDEIMAFIRVTPYSVMPLYEGTIDNVVGVFHAKDAMHILLDGTLTKEQLRAISREPYFIPESTDLYKQLLHFQRTKNRVGLVVNEYGDFMGLVTLSDLLEEVVGEFTTDPADTETLIHSRQDGDLLIDGSIAIRELNRRLKWNLPTVGPKTLNGLILEYLETIPDPGVSLKLHGYPIEIVHLADNTIKTVRYIGKHNNAIN